VILLHIARCIAKSDAKKDRSQRSYKMSKLTFGGYNKAFRPNRTKFDWLSRDEAEVDKYIADPFCGGVFTAGFFYDLFGGLIKNQDKKELANIPVQLPIYIFSGDKDPVGRFGKGVMRLFNTYRRLGIKDLSYKLYEGGRHEMLNETNREEVMTDVIDWLNRHVS
jgi:alpha-beta hydrolase superfamily lysophospholipase